MSPWEKYAKPESGPWAKYGQGAPEPEMGLGEKMNSAIADVPRQLGLTARYGIEGLGNVADLIASPARIAINAVTSPFRDGPGIQPGTGKYIADKLGLPEPQTPTERVVGEASKVVAGGGGMIGAAKGAAGLLSGTTQKVIQGLAARPDLQLSSAVGGGAAGGYAKETGGDELTQLIASLIGSVVAPIGVSGIQKAAGAAKAAINRITSPDITAKIDLVIDSAVKSQGMRLADVPESVLTVLRQDMDKALRSGELSPDVVRRLVDYRLVNATPTAGPLTLDPGTVTRQKNLAALGASSQDPNLQRLSQIENANNRQLIAGLNRVGADTADDALAAGQKVTSALSAKDAEATAKIGNLYSQARDSAGRSAKIDPSVFTQKVGELLDQANVGSFLPPDIKNKVNKIAAGEIPLTVDVAEQLKTSIAKIQRGSSDGNVRHALSLVRSALDDAPLLQQEGEAAINAFSTARAANKDWMKIVESTPALQAVRDGIEPDKFVDNFIIGQGNNASVNSVMKLRNLVKDSPEAMTAIKNNIAQHLKSKALNAAADEVGKFSQANYNKALSAIGDLKLKMFFSPEEIGALKAIGRVASYEQFQPAGSAVNNSKTAAAIIANVLDKIGSSAILRKIPLGAEFAGNPLRNISASMQAGNLTQIPSALVSRPPKEIGQIPPALLPWLLTIEE